MTWQESAEKTSVSISRSPERKLETASILDIFPEKMKKKKDGLSVSYIVYNANNPGLTHTLEHGHIVKNQYGTYGRSEAKVHIAPAADEGAQDFERKVKGKLK